MNEIANHVLYWTETCGFYFLELSGRTKSACVGIRLGIFCACLPGSVINNENPIPYEEDILSVHSRKELILHCFTIESGVFLK